ncbi:SKI family transcriptional corepressor 1 [Cygnus atratus]|uniref:SKI family transcriptional corepressor 1 n=1 Tax=Cygnus atratus TaxID=8868 RepID=UPI0015D64BC9|nr:SKI family transcriptional corepressor 1 [Cygnus atratus]
MEAIASQMGNGRDASSSPNSKQELQPYQGSNTLKPNQVGETSLYGVPIVSLVIDGQERLCLAQISNTLLKNYSYNEIHNRRVALGITCVQCTPVQLEILRRAGAMPISSRRCGMITKREAERLCKSFLGEHKPPKLPENFAFDVVHECAWGSRGSFIPARYNSSRAKCIKCSYCSMYFSPNKFIFHSHRTPDSKYTQPDAANFNSWRRHLKLSDKTATEELSHAWEDVKAMFNGGTRKRTFSLQGAPAAGPGGGSPAAKASLHPPPPAGPELAPAHKSLRCSGQEPAGERGALGLPAAHGGAAGAHGGAGAVRSYPVIPVPSKGFGMLQKLPPPLFPHPYGFPAAAFGLCPKKQEDALGGAGGGEPGKGGALPSGMFWGPPHPHPHQPAQPPHQPGAAKDGGVYPSFPMFWPAAGSLPVPPYPAQSQAKAAATAVVVAAAAAAAAAAAEPSGLAGRHGEPEGSEPSGSGRSSATPQEGSGADGERCSSALSRAAGEEERSGDEALLGPLPLPRKGSYLSAFRPVVKDTESIAKLYGTREAYGGGGGAARGPGYLSPDFLSEGSSSYRSLSPGGDTAEEPEVDVESNRFPEDDDEDAAAAAASAAAPEEREPPPPRLLAGPEEPLPAATDGPEEKAGEAAAEEGGQPPDGSPERSSSGSAYEVYAPERGEQHLQALKTTSSLGASAAYLCTPEAKEQDKEDNHSTAEDLETRKSYQDQRNVSHPSPVNTDRGEDGLGMDVAGTQLVEKDIENLARDELQKLVLEQMELRKKLERDFQSLKDNFQDQMKRELAYREEMVQQLQIVRDTLCNELDQERKARYAIQQKLKEAHDALHHFSCKMLTPRHCTGNCSFKPPLLPQ